MVTVLILKCLFMLKQKADLYPLWFSKQPMSLKRVLRITTIKGKQTGKVC